MQFFSGNIGKKVVQKGEHLVTSICDTTGKWHKVFFHGKAQQSFLDAGLNTGDFIRVGVSPGQEADNAFWLKVLRKRKGKQPSSPM